MSESIGQQWLRAHAHELNYDPKQLPDVGDYMVDTFGDPHMVTTVNRTEGWFEVEGGKRTVLPRNK